MHHTKLIIAVCGHKKKKNKALAGSLEDRQPFGIEARCRGGERDDQGAQASIMFPFPNTTRF